MNMKKKFMIVLSMAAVCILFCLARTTDVKAEEGTEENKIYNLNITVERNYDYAKQVLELVNQERIKAGVGTVKMDEELTEAAMIRAIETTVLYAHSRPNYTPTMTVCSVFAQENLAAGKTTPDAAMVSWMASEGHRSNILNKSWNSVGIGCIKYRDNYYWIQMFSEKEPTGIVPYGIKYGNENIEVSSKYLSLTCANIDTAIKGIATIMLSQPCIDGEILCFEPNPSSFTFASSNSSVATIDASGTITTKGNGTTTITAYYTGTKDVAYSRTINCTVGTALTVTPSSVPTIKPTTKPTNKPYVSPVSTPVTKEAVSSPRSYKVTYYCDVVFRKRNGERPTVKQVEKYTLLKKIKKPKKNGYTFQGWYTSDGKKFNFSKTIRSYTVLYAKWKKKR